MAKKFSKAETEARVLMAKEMFIYTDKTAKDICELVGISEQTISKHRIAEAWDEYKDAIQLSPERVLKKSYERLEQILSADKYNSDEFVKTCKAIEYLKGQKVSPHQAINVFKAFIEFIMSTDPKLSKEINLLQQKYITHLINSSND
jgi:predicted transcriptional regulator